MANAQSFTRLGQRIIKALISKP
ncbi:hypothetical protein OK016_11640 [Vibrio chagasii]|nr:hypothetical protein [Vibrio chagasii]